MKVAIRLFLREAACDYGTQLTPNALQRFVDACPSASRSSYLSHVHQFLRWGVKNYEWPLVIPLEQPRRRPVAPLGDRAYRRELIENMKKWQEETAAVAAQMHLPHQRAVFLCGYLLGLSLNKLVQIRLSDLLKMPVRADLYELLETLRAIHPNPGGRFFAPWFPSARGAHYTWLKWSGGVKFPSIAGAGRQAMIQNQIQPPVGRKARGELLMTLPLPTVENLERLPKWWGE